MGKQGVAAKTEKIQMIGRFIMVYICSDLHGYSLEKFKAFLDEIGFNDELDFLYILGDVIDRGSDGAKILNWIIDKENVRLILGNHESLMLNSDFAFIKNEDKIRTALTETKLIAYSNWIANSGLITLNALLSMKNCEVQRIINYLRKAPMFETITVNKKNFVLTHSGLGNFSCSKDLSEYTAMELLWNRPNIEDKYFDNATVVFGHTPTVYYGDEYEGKILFTDTWIDIDVGASMGIPPAILRLDDLKAFYCEK